tara:strand:- start:135 stop:413 length:279 start_codon:yes stop_codon:yes gene_type:complete
MSNEPNLHILDSNLVIDGDFTVNGTVYMVKTIADLDKIEGISSITIPPVSTSNEKINTASSIVIDGDFIICEELKYELTVIGSTTVLNTTSI